jgi:hypothetical protein
MKEQMQEIDKKARVSDNEIIKALTESVAVHAFPFYCFNGDGDRVDVHVTDVISLINRLDTKIDCLKEENYFLRIFYGLKDDEKLAGIIHETFTTKRQIEAEAIKGFAERLKEKASKMELSCNGELVRRDYTIDGTDLDNLVKEMVGEDK